MLKRYYADLHVHIGLNEEGRWVKMATSRRLTLRNVLAEAAERKGLDMIGVVDAASPYVQRDIERLVQEGLLTPLAGGGLCYQGRVAVILGAEVETTEEQGGQAHVLAFFPDLLTLRSFTGFLAKHVKNVALSSQNCHLPLAVVGEEVAARDGVVVPAHVFTPHKGLYGACTDRLGRVVPPRLWAHMPAVELGLSADSDMADHIAELQEITFVSNSDAHSLESIGREYNALLMPAADYKSLLAALWRQGEARVAANYGLNPRLGKYHRTYCRTCGRLAADAASECCAFCGSDKIVPGVLDRIMAIADYHEPHHPAHRPPYVYQIPLRHVPGIGPQSYARLLHQCGTEMHILHQASVQELTAAVGAKTAARIVDMRQHGVNIAAGGGGKYGHVLLPD